MTEIRQMYRILEEMLDSATRGDKQRVKELNASYEALVPKTYHSPLRPSDLAYDNCRQSCVMSFSMPTLREKFISDAKERLSNIPKPKR
jgi:hypothetical protein